MMTSPLISIEAQRLNNVETFLKANMGHEYSIGEIRTAPMCRDLLGPLTNDRVATLCLTLSRSGRVKRVRADFDPNNPTLKFKYRALNPGETPDMELVPSGTTTKATKCKYTKRSSPGTVATPPKPVDSVSTTYTAQVLQQVREQKVAPKKLDFNFRFDGPDLEITIGDVVLRMSSKG